ncbi:hypothetical protein FTO70_06410 [Methanosarcina sp. KYL-1]|uniref:hypothetical protein n=1 Tax=Methanosarcina sp. KYL-1 TaxID=2602068 RepID=UPI002101231C|nr:hypothetical protein [Methanosarcina sp. KYL-1]MCQ1535327.1 hypothetical protein [Methanosarcina sp. KYL-1]
MNSTQLLPSAFLGIVGTMYTLLVAVSVSFVQYFGRNTVGMKKVITHFTVLTVVVFIALAYNSYILYIVIGGEPLSRLHILAKLFPSKNYLFWAWAFSVLAVGYIFAFSGWLSYLVFLRVRSLRAGEIEAWKEGNAREIRALREKIRPELAGLEMKNAVLKQLKEEFLVEFWKSRAEIREKAQLIIDQEIMRTSGFISPGIKKMLDPETDFSGPDKNPFEEYIFHSERVEKLEDLPADMLKSIGEYRACLETINEKYEDFMLLYGEVSREKVSIFEKQQELEAEIRVLEEENEGLDDQLKELESVSPVPFIREEVSQLLKKSLFMRPFMRPGNNRSALENSQGEI